MSAKKGSARWPDAATSVDAKGSFEVDLCLELDIEPETLHLAPADRMWLLLRRLDVDLEVEPQTAYRAESHELLQWYEPAKLSTLRIRADQGPVKAAEVCLNS